MLRIQPYLVVASLAALCLVSCVLPPGQAWQQAELQVEALFEMDGRVLENGRFKTSKDYELSFRSIEVLGLGFRTEALSSETPLTLFDPQNPPPGYGLCHNGHCHNEDNELIDYEDIQEELNQASGAASNALFQALEAPLKIQNFTETTVTPMALGPCDDVYQLCDLGPDSQVAKIIFEPLRIVVTLDVFHEDSLPEEGLSIDSQSISIDTPIELTLSGAPDLENGILPVQLTMNKSLWDSIEFLEATTNIDSADVSAQWNEAELERLMSEAFVKHTKLILKPNL